MEKAGLTAVFEMRPNWLPGSKFCNECGTKVEKTRIDGYNFTTKSGT